MRARWAFAGILLCALAYPATSEDGAGFINSFDVPGGEVQLLHADELTLGNLITCRIWVEDVYFDPDWVASFNVVFVPEAEPDEGSQLIRLSAYRADEDEGWRYVATIEEPGRHRSRITAYTGESDTLLQMNMFLEDENLVGFFVGNDAVNHSLIDVSNLNPTIWEVLVTGMKGIVECGDLGDS